MTNSPNYCRCHLFLFVPAQSESSLSLPGYHFPLLNPFMPCLWHSYSNKQRHFLWHTWCILMMVHCQLCHWLRLFPASLFFKFPFKCNILCRRLQKSLRSWVAVWYLTLSCFLHLASAALFPIEPDIMDRSEKKAVFTFAICQLNPHGT